MPAEDVKLILRELDNLKQQNSAEHQDICNRQDHTNGSVAEVMEWKLKNEELLENIKEERKVNRIRLTDTLYKIGVIIIICVFFGKSVIDLIQGVI